MKENTTKVEIDSRMFNSVVSVQVDKRRYNAILYAVKVSENEIIPVVITSKSILKGNVTVLLNYTNSDGAIALGSMTVPSKMWHISKNYDIGIWPCANFMLAIRARGNTLTNVPLIEQMAISKKDLLYTNLIEKTFSIGYIGSIHNDVNNWPLSYVTYTASPITQNFDGKPYFLLNGNEPNNILGAPVFINIAYEGRIGIRFVGMWMEQSVKTDMVGPNDFSAILKAEKIIEFANKVINKIQKDEKKK